MNLNNKILIVLFIIAILFVIASVSLTVLSLKSSDRSITFDEIETNDINNYENQSLPELPQLD